ncbi:MAG: hypothetical protein ABI435_01270 [Pseudolysinimonas sp.]
MDATPRSIIAVIAGLLGVTLVAVAILVFLAPRSAAPAPGSTPTAEAALTWAPAASPPVAAANPTPGISGLPDPAWVSSTAAATGIPARALAAYAGAAMAKAASMPECGISWNTIAGIGKVESGHGQYAGSSIGADGTVTPPIYGPPLDGGDGVQHVPDSDGGAIDGDATIDRASGPFQLIPQTWRNWHTDGNGDGVEDPQNIEDGAMATVNYLCRVSIHMDTEEGWIAAIKGFNSPASYRELVARYAVQYGAA